MSMPTKIVDKDTGQAASVSEFGELVVSVISPSITTSVIMTPDGEIFNLIKPLTGKFIRITGALISTRRDVGNEGAIITIYESDSEISSNVNLVLLTADLSKQTSRDILPLNLEVQPGIWINAVSDDSTVDLTLLYHYV